MFHSLHHKRNSVCSEFLNVKLFLVDALHRSISVEEKWQPRDLEKELVRNVHTKTKHHPLQNANHFSLSWLARVSSSPHSTKVTHYQRPREFSQLPEKTKMKFSFLLIVSFDFFSFYSSILLFSSSPLLFVSLFTLLAMFLVK